MHHTNHQKRICLTFVGDYFGEKMGRKGHFSVHNSL